MGIKLKKQVVDSVTDQPVDIVTCACENDVFYILTNGNRICASCNMTVEEAEAAKLEREAEQAKIDLLSEQAKG